MAAVVAGCTRSPETPTGTSAATLPPTAIKLANGGEVTIGVPYLPTNYNPSSRAGANRVTQMVMEQVWPQAFVIDPTFQAETTGFVDSAELISLSPQTIQYKIDAGAQWSDGTPITVDDFVYNWHEQLAHASTVPFRGTIAGYKAIASIVGTDGGKSVTITFRTTYADWEGLFTDLVPAHVARVIGWAGFLATAPSKAVSGGPFAIATFVPGRQLVLERNPKWWGTPAHLERIVFRVERSDAATWSGLESGTLSVGEVEPSATTPLRAAIDGLASATTLSPLEWQICFNLNDALVSQPLIREAVAEASDRLQLVADTIGLLDPGAPVLQNRVFLQNSPGWQSNPAQFGIVDVAGADALLVQAGYHLAASGYYVRDGKPISLTMTAPGGNLLVTSIEAVFEAEMREAGIRVRFDNVPFDTLMSSVLTSSTYQLALAPFVGTTYPSWTEPLYTPAGAGGAGGVGAAAAGARSAAVAGAGGVRAARAALAGLAASGATGFVAWDVSGLSDPAIATLYNQAETQLSALTARGLYNEIDSLLWKDLPTLPLFQVPVTLVTEHNLVNVEESPTWAGPMWNAQDWGIALNLPPVTPTTG